MRDALPLVLATLPADAWAALLVAATVVLPGVPAGIAIARRLGMGWTGAVATALCVTSAAAGVVMLAGPLAGVGLGGGIVAMLVALAAATVIALRAARPSPPVRPGLAGVALAAGAAAVALVQGPWLRPSADTFYHLAAARSLLVRDALVVTDPFHATAVATADPSSGVLHTMLAMAQRVTGADMLVLWTGMTVVGAALTVAAFHALAARVAGDGPRAGAAAAVATALYCVCTLVADLRAAAYPNRISLAIVFVGLALVVELLERPSAAAALGVGVAAAAVSAMHVGSAELFVLLVLAVGAWSAIAAATGRLRASGGAPAGAGAGAPARAGWWLPAGVAGVVLVAAAFLASKVGVVAGSSMVDSASALARADLFRIGPFVVAPASAYFDGGDAAFVLTAALVVLMGGWAAIRRDRAALAAFAICSAPVLLLACPPVTTLAARVSFYNLARIAALLGFTTPLAIAWALARRGREGGARQAWALGTVAATVLVVLAVPYLRTTWADSPGAVRRGMNVSVWKARLTDVRAQWGFGETRRLVRAIGEDAPVVASDPETGYYLSGLATVRLVAVPRSHSPLAIELVSGAARRAAMRELMLPTTSEPRRREILDEWGADLVLVWLSRPGARPVAASMEAQPGLFRTREASTKLRLYEVVR